MRIRGWLDLARGIAMLRRGGGRVRIPSDSRGTIQSIRLCAFLRFFSGDHEWIETDKQAFEIDGAWDRMRQDGNMVGGRPRSQWRPVPRNLVPLE